jgi:hypothetical protein
MGQADRHTYSNAVSPNRYANRDRSVRYAKRRAKRRAYTFIAFILFFGLAVLFAIKPASAATKTLLQSMRVTQEAPAQPAAQEPSESIVQFQPAVEAPKDSVAAEFAIRDANALSIKSWQGALNCGESFDITLSGVAKDEPVSFSTTNCTVFPQTGTGDGVYTVTVTGSGTYSATATSASVQAHKDTRSGVAGKADQTALNVSGWGGGDDYYDHFNIRVSGGSTGGAITFQTDGCSVSPATGNADTIFEVTVTRVGAYELTAMMDGNNNYNSAYSARLSGSSGKSNQSPVKIDDWVENASCGDTFVARIYGGSTSEALTLAPSGCTCEKLSADKYKITIDSVGPYALSVSRAGNYGYNLATAFASGIAQKTSAPSLGVSGWSDTKNCNDSFPIRITGGISGAEINFAASGCMVNPATGTNETNYTVTVTSAGGYSLRALMGGSERYESAESHSYHGQSGKGTQQAIQIQNWNEAAPAGSSFEMAVSGGSGSGATTVTTDEGCTARLKAGESNVYLIYVYPLAGKSYSVSVNKAGDATYDAATPQTVVGTTSGVTQAALAVNGWKDDAYSGDSFEITLAGGSGSGSLNFELNGCKVAPADGSLSDTYTVTVTATEGNPYSLSVSHAGDGNYMPASAAYNGTAKLFAAGDDSSKQILVDDEPIVTNSYSWLYICGGIVLLFGIVLLTMQALNAPRRRRRR